MSGSFSMDSLFDALNEGYVIPVNNYDYYPIDNYSFYNNGNEYEITSGKHHDEQVIKVRYNNSLTPLYKKNDTYYISVYAGKNEENRIQFKEIYGNINQRSSFFQPKIKISKIKISKSKIVKPKPKIKKIKPIFGGPSQSYIDAQKKQSAASAAFNRKYDREINKPGYKPMSVDDLSDLMGTASFNVPIKQDKMKLGFGQVKNRFKQIKADIKYLLHL